MTTEGRGRSRTAIAVAVATVCATGLTLAVVAVTGDSDWEDAPFLVAGLVFGFVGAAILARQAGHRIGWIFGIIGIALPLGGLQELAASLAEDGVLSGGLAVVFGLGNALWWMFLYFVGVLIPLWFPTGLAPSRWWRWPAWLGGVFWLGATVLDVFADRICILLATEGRSCAYEVANPIGIPGLEGAEESSVGGVLFLFLAIAIIGAVSSLVVRFVRSRGVERLQLKWLTYSFSLLLSTIFAEEGLTRLFAEVPDWVWATQSAIFALAVLFIPISVGIAITRYHLYDVDRIVNRTITYAIVVGGLALIFAAGAVWLPQQLPTANNNLAVAASTLVVAALFNPLRRRVQRVVDRRFHRLPYDAEVIGSDLADRIRDETSPTGLGGSWLTATANALQPAQIAVWVKEPDWRWQP